MKKIQISFFLIAALLLTQLPVLSAEAAPVGGEVFSEDFTEDVTAYAMTTKSGIGAAVTNEVVFKQITEDGNRFGRFCERGNDWGRYGFEFDETGISEGQLKIHFRFRPYDKTFESGSFGAVLIGNCDAKFNWLTLVNVQANGTITAGCANSTLYPLKDASGANAAAVQDTWYTYDAALNLDTHSMDVKVTEDGTNTSYALELTNLPPRGGRNEWLHWPDVTNFKEFAVMFPMDLDDIEISYMPLTATGLSFLNGLGASSDQADLYTKQVAVHFNYPVTGMQFGAVMLDGTDYSSSGILSDDGKTYTFTLQESLAEDREYSVVVNPEYITAADSRFAAGESTTLKFTPASVGKWSEDFTEDVTVYNFTTSSGLGSKVTDEGVFNQMTEGGNRFGRFFATGGTWGRSGFEFDKTGISGGRLKIHFRFRPFERTLEASSFGAVLIGNCDAKYNWLTLVNVQADGMITTACANGSTYPLKDVSGANAKAVQDIWYTYDAVVNLDTHSLDVTVAQDGTNAVYTLELKNLTARGKSDEWKNWPHETLFKDFGVMFPMDLDDIKISYMPLSVANLGFINGSGDETGYATELTSVLRLNFSAAVQDISGKISLDGQVQDARLSADGMYCDINLPSGLTVGTAHTLSIAEGIYSFDSRIPPSEAQTFTFTVSDVNQIFAEDYEGESTADFVPFNGSGVCKVAEQDGNRYGRISTNWGRAGYQFAASAQGKVRVRFRFMFDSVSRTGDNAYSYVRFGHENGNADGYINDPLTLLCRQGSELRFAHYTQSNTEYRLGTVQAGVWYSYDAVLDLDAHSVHLIVSTDEGTKNITKVIPLKEPSANANNRYIGWPNENIFDQLSFVCAVNVDDILIEKVFDLPEVTAESIRLLKANGEAETDLTAVNPSVNHIQINFGEYMNADSVTPESLQLTAADGSSVQLEGGGFDSSGRVYTINFDGLKSNTDYKLTVSGKVENINGGEMGADMSVTFTTGAGTLSAGIDSVTADGAEVNNLSALTGTVQVKVTVPNASDKDSVAAAYLAYYNANNEILNIQEKHLNAPAGKTTAETLSFTVSKPAGTIRAVILLWSGDGTPLQARRELR